MGFAWSLEVGIDGKGCVNLMRKRELSGGSTRLMGGGMMPRARDRIPQARVITFTHQVINERPRSHNHLTPISISRHLPQKTSQTHYLELQIERIPVSGKPTSFSHPYAQRQVPESRWVFECGCARTPLFSTSSIWGGGLYRRTLIQISLYRLFQVLQLLSDSHILDFGS